MSPRLHRAGGHCPLRTEVVKPRLRAWMTFALLKADVIFLRTGARSPSGSLAITGRELRGRGIAKEEINP